MPLIPFAQTPTQPPVWVSLFPLLVLFVLFYFMLIRPQRRARREQDTMLNALKKHDNVVTVGGLHGTILNVKDAAVTLRVDDNVKVEVDRSAIARVTHKADS